MSFPITITLDNPEPSLRFTNYSDLFTVIRQNITGEVDETVKTFVTSYATPAVDDQDLLWFRLDSDGRPRGWYNFFSSVWTPVEPGISARLGFFIGDPTPYFDGTGLGLKGAGPVANDYWGWALMNGNNGTPNLSDRFIVLGRMDNVGITGYDVNWRTNINGVPEVTGGNAEITLDATTSYTPSLTVGVHDATGESLDNSGKLYGKVGDGSADLAIFSGNTAPNAISVVNPFYALAMIIFVGYVG